MKSISQCVFTEYLQGIQHRAEVYLGSVRAVTGTILMSKSLKQQRSKNIKTLSQSNDYLLNYCALF